MTLDKILGNELPLTQITTNELDSFFSMEQDENIRLEMKSYDGGTRNGQPQVPESIFKTLSAFSNNDGGILIWGAPLEKSEKDAKGKVIRKYCTGNPEYLPITTDIDALCRKIRSGISPSASHIEIHGVKKENLGYVIFFRVGKTMLPIMSNDHRFYIRTNLESEKAPFAIVDALFKRRGHSDLNMTEIELDTNKIMQNTVSGNINFEISNDTAMISAEQAYVEIIPNKSILITNIPQMNLESFLMVSV